MFDPDEILYSVDVEEDIPDISDEIEPEFE